MSDLTADCPLQCLASVLPRVIYAALETGLGNPAATVGDVVALCEQGKLTELPNISYGRLGRIRFYLLVLGLLEPEYGESRWPNRRDQIVVVHGEGCLGGEGDPG